jgi:hypothetical protein
MGKWVMRCENATEKSTHGVFAIAFAPHYQPWSRAPFVPVSSISINFVRSHGVVFFSFSRSLDYMLRRAKARELNANRPSRSALRLFQLTQPRP